ncbi:MAG: UPF0175 family protein [Acidobacteriota bacterium]
MPATIVVSDEILNALRENPEDFEKRARFLLARDLYAADELSTGMAAKVAGLPVARFVFLLGEQGLSPFGTEPEDLDDELVRLRAHDRG